MNREETAALLKDWAVEAGFDFAGVAALEDSANGEAFRRWLGRGDHAGMDYMARRVELRLSPAEVLPGGRSAVCVGLRYAPHCDEAAPAGEVWSRVARYARGLDYHEVMGERLAALGKRVEEALPGTATRWYVDTGPILERELAARAGLGAVGKNTMLLHPEHGSYFLLGELLTTLDLAADVPLADLCGSCTRCLDACPTGALPEAYRLDSNRCLSYLTIEHRGRFAEGAESLVAGGGWIFGCDVCQEVCPWNAGPPEVAAPAFGLAPERRRLRLADLIEMGPEDYRALFRGSPLKRAKLEGLRRNASSVASALG